MSNIDISGLDKAAVLATLFNASAPAGMGFLQAANGPTVMSIEDAQKVINGFTSPEFADNLYFDYLFGRPLKINLSGDSFDPWGFDRDNGGNGTAARLIDELRAGGPVESDNHKQTRTALLIERSDVAMSLANTQSHISHENGIINHQLGGSDVGDVLEKAIDREIDRHGV